VQGTFGRLQSELVGEKRISKEVAFGIKSSSTGKKSGVGEVGGEN